MAIWRIDPDNGNDANDGSTWALAKKTMYSIASSSVAAGDEVRFAKSPSPVSAGSADWTEGSTSVVFTDTPAFAATDLISRTAADYWGAEPWHGVVSIVGNTITLKKPYRGTTGSYTTYYRVTTKSKVNPTTIRFSGASAINGTPSNKVVISGGWDTTSDARTSQTFFDGVDGTYSFLNMTGSWVDILYMSYTRYGSAGVGSFAVNGAVVAFDNVIENYNVGASWGSGITDGGTLTINCCCGNVTDGIHIHTSWNSQIYCNKIYDNSSGISENNDFLWNVGNAIMVGDVAHNTYYGLALNYPNRSAYHADQVHHHPLGAFHSELEGGRGDSFFQFTDVHNCGGVGIDYDGPGTVLYEDLWDGTIYVMGAINEATPVRFQYGTVDYFSTPTSPTFAYSTGDYTTDSTVLFNGQNTKRLSAYNTPLGYTNQSFFYYKVAGTANTPETISLYIRRPINYIGYCSPYIRVMAPGGDNVHAFLSAAAGDWELISATVTPTENGSIVVEICVPISTGSDDYVNIYGLTAGGVAFTASVSSANGFGSAAHLTATYGKFVAASTKPVSAAGSVSKMTAAYARYMIAQIKSANAVGTINRLAAEYAISRQALTYLKGHGNVTYPMYIKTQ